MRTLMRAQTLSEAPLPPVVDGGVLLELMSFSGDDDRDFFKDQVELFVRRGAGLIEQINAAAAVAAVPDAHRLAHALAGTAGSIGAIRLRDLCLEFERLPATSQRRLLEVADAIDDEFLKVAAMLKVEVASFYVRS